jgi:hypothetical protein
MPKTLCSCSDPACRRSHFIAACVYCGDPIEEAQLIMAGCYQNVPLHEDCGEKAFSQRDYGDSVFPR